MHAIVIGTSKGREGWLGDCLASLAGVDLPVTALYSEDFELSVIAWAAELYDEFIFVPDSTIFLRPGELVEECFTHRLHLGVSLSQFPGPFGMYLGKYVSAVVRAVGVPYVADKVAAVRYETVWTRQYAAEAPWEPLGTLGHTDVFEERHGRLNMVCENHWLRRYKASWDGSTMMQEQQRLMRLKGSECVT